MYYSKITPSAERLLKEILDYRTDNGNCDMFYWRNRFESLNMSGRIQIQSIFQELRDSDMIFTVWKLGYFENLVVLEKGLSYFYLKNEKEEYDKKRKKEEKDNIKREEKINRDKSREKRQENICSSIDNALFVTGCIASDVIDTVEILGTMLFFWF